MLLLTQEADLSSLACWYTTKASAGASYPPAWGNEVLLPRKGTVSSSRRPLDVTETQLLQTWNFDFDVIVNQRQEEQMTEFHLVLDCQDEVPIFSVFMSQ